MKVDWIGGCCCTRVIYYVSEVPKDEEKMEVEKTIQDLENTNHEGGAHLVQLNLTDYQSAWFPYLESLGFKLVQKFYNGRYRPATDGAALMHVWQLVIGESQL